MSNLKADITDLVQPVAGTNAIERVTLGIEWASELSNQVMQRLSKFLDETDHPFPRKVEIHAKEFVGEGSTLPDLPTQKDIELVGIVLKQKPKGPKENGPDFEFEIQQNSFVFSAENDFSGWTSIRDQALPLAGKILNELAEEIAVVSVGLQLVDVFYLTERNIDFSRILDKTNINLPPRIFSDYNYWHLDQGFFDSNLDEDRQVLTNLQLAYSPSETSDKLSITCLHRVFVQKDYGSRVGDILASYDVLYERNKELVESLLVSEVCDLIGLKKSKGVQI